VLKIIACLISTVWRKIVIPVHTLTQLNQQYTSVYTTTKCFPVPIHLIKLTLIAKYTLLLK